MQEVRKFGVLQKNTLQQGLNKETLIAENLGGEVPSRDHRVTELLAALDDEPNVREFAEFLVEKLEVQDVNGVSLMSKFCEEYQTCELTRYIDKLIFKGQPFDSSLFDHCPPEGRLQEILLNQRLMTPEADNFEVQAQEVHKLLSLLDFKQVMCLKIGVTSASMLRRLTLTDVLHDKNNCSA